MTSHNLVQTLRSRRGFTLMEVLISIGVVAIGLLGVLQLLPLAHHQAFVGTQEDRKAVVGRAAFHAFRVRGMHRCSQWITSGGASVLNFSALPQRLADVGNPGSRMDAYCIDPLFLAYNPSISKFPYDTNAGIPLDRITMNLGAGVPSTGMAEAAMVMQDDLTYEIPSDALSPPLQVDASNGTSYWNGANAAVTKRATDGRFAWFATVVPDIEGERDMYVVSIVVTYNRFRQRIVDGNDPREERSVSVNFLTGGFSGGDVTLQTRGGPADDLAKIRAGDWIMVGAQLPGGSPIKVYKWYRVVQADGDIGGAGPFTRDVTLQGPDWNPAWGTTAEGTLCEGAVGVYSKTMRLETGSLWAAP